MSGIIGLFQLDWAPISENKLESMALALSLGERQRPQLWCPKSKNPLGLGHIRRPLSLPDEGPKRQVCYDENLVIEADARLENRAELAKALKLSVEQLHSWPNSLFILKAYEKWGEDCPKHLLGDFVFILWDSRQRKLFCARDQLGNRVLFYHQSIHFLAIASAPKALLALPDVPRQINETTLADFLVLQGDATATFYKDIYRLPPAHTLIATEKGMEIRKYWSLYPTKRIILKSDDEYVEAFHEIFEEAVRCRLHNVSFVGAFLSGGLDSSSVASTAARQLKAKGQRLAAFTSVPRKGFDGPEPPGWLNDETPYVEAIKKWHDNIDVTYIRSEGRTMLDNLDHLFQMVEAPILNPCNRIWIDAVLEAAQAQGVHVLLNGQYGNGTISYDGESLFTEMARGGRWLTLMREINAKAALKQISPLAVFKQNLLLPFLPNAFWTWYRRKKDGPKSPWTAYSAINPVYAKEMAIDERANKLGFDHYFRPKFNGRSWRIHWGYTSDTASYGHEWFDALRLNFGIEQRDPTADKRVFEFCLAIPEEQYLRNGKSRYLIRRAMKGILPPEVLWKTKRGAQLPDWYEQLTTVRGEIAAELDRLEKIELARRCLDLPRMRRLVTNWPQGNWNDPKIVMEYRYLLERGIMVGRFIRWFEEGRAA